MKIAWDIGNGTVGAIIDQFIQQLSKAEHIVINKEVDRTFPNHHPDPTVPENMEQLIETVLTNSCDIGLEFDGDGDRVGVIDNNGNEIYSDKIGLLIARNLAPTHRNKTVS